MKKIRIVFALWASSARSIRPGVEVNNNLSAFKKEVKNILNSEKDKDGIISFFRQKYNKGTKVSIGRYDAIGEYIKDWTPLSKLPPNFLDGYEYYDFCISIK